MTEMIRLTRGVHRAGEQVSDDLSRAAALLTVCPDGTVVAGRSAARLHGLWLPPSTRTPFEVVLRGRVGRPESRAGCRRPEVRGRRRRLHRDDTALLGGVPVTTPTRTWLDLAESLPLPDLVAAGDSVLRTGATAEQFAAVIGRAMHVRGVVRARQAVELLDARSRSRMESLMRVAIVTSGLPAPEVNVAIHDDLGQWLFEPDLSYADVRLAIEYKGADHGDTPRMRKDMTRTVDGYLRGRWQVIEFGPSEVLGRPDQVAAMVARLRAERAGLRHSAW